MFPPPLPAGMDHAWYDFSPYPNRPQLDWPKGARIAFAVVLHLEYWPLAPDEGAHRDPPAPSFTLSWAILRRTTVLMPCHVNQPSSV